MHFIRSLAVLTAAFLPFQAIAAPLPATSSGPTFSIARAGEKISDHYIIVLKKGVDSQAFETHMTTAMAIHNNRLVRRDDPTLTGMEKKYEFGTFKGYSGCFDSSTIEQINNIDEVDFVEADQIMVAKAIISQRNSPSWGLPRISQKNRSNSANSTTYFYDESAGEGVTAYVIDTGINIAHQDFEGRAVWGVNTADNLDEDGQGHGTHVAGTIGGATFGVAKKVDLIAVKVLGSDGSGTNSGVIEGVQWTTADAVRKGKAGKSVANMSLGGSVSSALNRAVEAAVAAGITFAVAAGNENEDARNSSPASTRTAITVGATEIDDSRASFSNFGPLVDVFAPGTDITSAWIGSDTAINTISGTSMASPHVAGLAAYLIAAEGLTGSQAVTARILSLATRRAVTNPGTGSPNVLIYNGSGK